MALDKGLALLAPSEVFATPENVRDSGDLTRDEKAEILRRWSNDAAALEVAVDLEQTGPTKQHGVSVGPVAPKGL
jgi:hypothetical protein